MLNCLFYSLINYGIASPQPSAFPKLCNSSASTAANSITPITPPPTSKKQLVKKHHCPKSTEGTPRTLTELKIYSSLLDWDKHSILIFYEEAIPQGFSQTFLDALARFNATICLITDTPHPTIPTFSPQDPHLIQTIMIWLQRTILEI